MKPRVFLGGSCGATGWRREIAIPLLAAAGLDWFDPQVAEGQRSAAEHEVRDMRAKAECEVLLFVVGGGTRGVASLAEAAYLIAAGRPLALFVADLDEAARIDGLPVAARERDDLNRGRLFVRTMAAHHSVPCWPSIEAAVAYAVRLAHRPPLDLAALRAIVQELDCGDLHFVAGEEAGLLYLSVEQSGQQSRRWLIEAHTTPSEVARTALKAVLTWHEHEARERFRYRGQPVFDPHLELDVLSSFLRAQR